MKGGLQMNPRKAVGMSTGKIGKKNRLERARQEAALKINREGLEAGPPSWLDETARAEFERVVSEAAEINLFDNLDLSGLALYAGAFSRYIEAEKHLNEEGLVIGKKQMPSPWLSVSEKAAAQILKCSSKLGLMVTDRLRLVVPKKEEVKSPAEKWLQFLPSRGGAAKRADSA